MSKFSGRPNRQVDRTKSWILEAVILLMDEKPYSKISVLDISEKAGIARQTFYYYYADKDDIIFEYLMNTMNTELLNVEKGSKHDGQNNIVFMFDYKYMIKHQKNLIKILSIADIETRMYREVQKLLLTLMKQYRTKLTAEEYLICRYQLFYQITGNLKVLFDWFIHNMPMPVEKIVDMLNKLNIPKSIQYSNIPSILVKLKTDI